MINANKRNYDYYLYADKSSYGQQTLIKGEDGQPSVQGSIKMTITNTSTSIQDNIKYKDAAYLGLTYDEVSDRYVIQYGDARLKVLYVNPLGRQKQVFMSEI